MEAIFSFIPHQCPYCGALVLTAEDHKRITDIVSRDGTAKAACHNCGCSFTIADPATVKAFATGRSRTDITTAKLTEG